MYDNKKIEEHKKDIRMREREIVDLKNKIFDIANKVIKKIPVKYYKTDTGAVKILKVSGDGLLIYRDFSFFGDNAGDFNLQTHESFRMLIDADEWISSLDGEITQKEFHELILKKLKNEIEKY